MIGKIPADKHYLRSQGVKLSDEGNIIPVPGNQNKNIKMLIYGKFIGFQGKPDIDALFLGDVIFSVPQGKIMGDNIFTHQNVFKYAFTLDFLSQFFGGRPALKIMGVDDLALTYIRAGHNGDLASDKFMEAGNAYTGFFFVFIFIIVADLIKIITIVKNPYP
jgi:hypothetical protein